MINSLKRVLVVVGDEGTLVWGSGGPVVPDGGGQGQQPLGDAGEDAVGGVGAVAFQAELALEAVVDRFDPLAEPAEVAVPVRLVAAGGAQPMHAQGGDLGLHLAPRQGPVRPDRGARG